MLPEDLSVDVSGGVLSIQGEHSDQRKRRDESGRVFRTERVRRRSVGGRQLGGAGMGRWGWRGRWGWPPPSSQARRAPTPRCPNLPCGRRFARSFTLPDNVDHDAISANMEHGAPPACCCLPSWLLCLAPALPDAPSAASTPASRAFSSRLAVPQARLAAVELLDPALTLLQAC
jgi:hypothetical protein